MSESKREGESISGRKSGDNDLNGVQSIILSRLVSLYDHSSFEPKGLCFFD